MARLGCADAIQITAGMDSLLSIVQMPKGIPVGTLAIGNAGATNAALMAGAILSIGDPTLAKRIQKYREKQTQAVLAERLDDVS